MGVLYLFRAICMASTQLPIANKNYYCSPQVSLIINHLNYILSLSLLIISVFSISLFNISL